MINNANNVYALPFVVATLRDSKTNRLVGYQAMTCNELGQISQRLIPHKSGIPCELTSIVDTKEEAAQLVAERYPKFIPFAAYSANAAATESSAQPK